MLMINKNYISHHVLWLEGIWCEDNKEVNLVNIYAPCDGRRKQALWTYLSRGIQAKSGERICLMAV
jgi:hypothetical protein